MFSFQNNLNEHVISSERGDFKLSIGGLNNKFPYMVEGLPNICNQHNMAANGNEECKAKSYEPKLEKKTSETIQQYYFCNELLVWSEGLVLQLHWPRP